MRLIFGLLACVAAFGQVHISPTTRQEEGTSTTIRPDSWAARGFDLQGIISRVYQVDPSRIDFPITLEDGKRYDFEVASAKPESVDDLVKEAIQDRFHITVTREVRPMDVFVMTGSLPESSSKDSISRITVEGDHISATGATMDRFRRVMEQRLGHPIVDETNLKGRYNFDVRGEGQGVLEMLHDKLGLTLTPERRNIEILVVGKRGSDSRR